MHFLWQSVLLPLNVYSECVLLSSRWIAQMVLRQGEQHDLIQFTRDFLDYYKMSNPQSVEAVANAMHQR